MRPRLDIRSVFTIAKKEFMDNVRNKWIMALTIIFIVLTLAISLAVGGGEIVDFEVTALGLLSISTLLVPIIAIMLGYNTISGEAETGSLQVVLSTSIRRHEVLIGKYVGLGSVLALATLLGFGISGLVIMTQASANAGGYLVFIILTIMLGLIYLSLSMCFSTIMKKRVTSLIAGIGIFFWAMIIGTVIMVIYFATGGSVEGVMNGMPDWMWGAMMILSPSDMYQTSVFLGFSTSGMDVMGFSIELPEFIVLWKLIIIYLAWTFIPLVLAYLFLERRDF
jgi:Cu-processing system permease protein